MNPLYHNSRRELEMERYKGETKVEDVWSESEMIESDEQKKVEVVWEETKVEVVWEETKVEVWGETKVEVWGETIESEEQKKKRKKEEESKRPMFEGYYEMLRSGRHDHDQRVWKRSAWAEPPPRLRKPLPIGLAGDLELQSSIQCDACANIIAQGSILPSRDRPYRYYIGYPIKHYLNCPNCSEEMVIETVEGNPGFKSLVGATEYSGPVDERNKVVPEFRRKILTPEILFMNY